MCPISQFSAMKYLLISILYCYPTCLLAQAVEDTILTNYFNKVGIEELSKVSSYVYFYRSLSNYDESMFFTGKDSKANIMFYKRKKQFPLNYRKETQIDSTKSKFLIGLYNKRNSTHTLLENGQVMHIGQMEHNKNRSIFCDYGNYSFEVCKQLMEAHKNHNLSYVGEEDFVGNASYKYFFESEYQSKFVFFDKESYLLTGTQNLQFNESENSYKIIVERFYEDYIDVEGILIPKVIRTIKNGEFYDSFTFENIKFNVTLKDDLFHEPLEKSEFSF
jgi:hypothetical protein